MIVERIQNSRHTSKWFNIVWLAPELVVTCQIAQNSYEFADNPADSSAMLVMLMLLARLNFNDRLSHQLSADCERTSK
jgi:hypothetical protein